MLLGWWGRSGGRCGGWEEGGGGGVGMEGKQASRQQTKPSSFHAHRSECLPGDGLTSQLHASGLVCLRDGSSVYDGTGLVYLGDLSSVSEGPV